MKFETAFLRSRLARRVFGLFVLSALLPIGVTAVLSLWQVTQTLTEQTLAELRHASVTYGMSILDRLQSVEVQLRALAFDISADRALPDKPKLTLKPYFKTIGVLHDTGEITSLLGHVDRPLDLTSAETAHLGARKTALSVASRESDALGILMSRIVDPQRPDRGILIAELNPSFLWGGREGLPANIDFCVLDERHTELYCSHAVSPFLLAAVTTHLAKSVTGVFRHQQPDQTYLAGYRSLFLKPQFLTSGWAVVASQPEALALAAVTEFKKTFLLAIPLSLFVIMLLSVRHIRRRLAPLERLMEGTQHIANREFSYRISVNSGDEFEGLAASFNTMATRLHRQFNTFSVLSEIDRLILAKPNAERLSEILLVRIGDCVPCDVAGVITLNQGDSASAKLYLRDALEGDSNSGHEAPLSLAEVNRFLDCPDGTVIAADELPERYLEILKGRGGNHFYVFPVVLQTRFSGALMLGYREQPSLTDEDWRQVGDFADRMGVALSAEAHERRLKYQAYYDSLTDTPNRHLLKIRVEEAIARAQQEQGMAALLFIDLDHFKGVNDSHGHAAGDELLKQAVQRLRSCVRATDTVARFGGDEFVILVSGIGLNADAGRVAQDAIEALSEPFVIKGVETFINASIGIALYPADATAEDKLLMNADTAMYAAKQAGRGRYLFFSEQMNAAAVARALIERDLHQALAKDQFLVYYQPQVDCRTRQIVGVEAVIRWHHPERGLVSPIKFIPVAEDTGQIIEIGAWILRTACREIASLQATLAREIRVSANFSPRQFMHPGVIELIEQALSESSLRPDCLEAEITESVALHDHDTVVNTLSLIKSKGITVAIDDFGTGYSSLSQLGELPVDNLKVDRAFIKDIGEGGERGELASAIIAMGRSLGLTVTAEGVETEAQFQFLREQGCDKIQGFLISPPVPLAALEALLREHDGSLPNADSARDVERRA